MRLSGLKYAVVMAAACPRNSAMIRPVATSHTRAVVSPRFDRVAACSDDSLAVGTEIRPKQLTAMCAQFRHEPSAPRVPYSRRAIAACRDDQGPIRAEGRAVNESGMAAQFEPLLSGRRMPHSGGAIRAGGHNALAVGAQLRTADTVGMPTHDFRTCDSTNDCRSASSASRVRVTRTPSTARRMLSSGSNARADTALAANSRERESFCLGLRFRSLLFGPASLLKGHEREHRRDQAQDSQHLHVAPGRVGALCFGGCELLRHGHFAPMTFTLFLFVPGPQRHACIEKRPLQFVQLEFIALAPLHRLHQPGAAIQHVLVAVRPLPVLRSFSEAAMQLQSRPIPVDPFAQPRPPANQGFMRDVHPAVAHRFIPRSWSTSAPRPATARRFRRSRPHPAA